jgi:RNA polymerase sigma-70 factor (ECF subfamily)
MNEPSKAPEAAADDLDRADMLRLCAGHDAALNDLMERHGPRLFNYLFRSLQNEDDASDLAQETFVRVFHNRAKFNPNHKFSIWLYAIASNLVRTQFRHRTRHPTVPLNGTVDTSDTPTVPHPDTLPHDAPNPSESLETSETADAVRQAIANLPEELRTPLILSEYEDLSHAEIGSILDCSPKAVETRLYRARKQLRAVLSRFIGHD